MDVIKSGQLVDMDDFDKVQTRRTRNHDATLSKKNKCIQMLTLTPMTALIRQVQENRVKPFFKTRIDM